MKTKTKVKIKFFIKRQLWQYILVLGSVALCCYIFNKWFEGIAFIIAHCTLRYEFKHQYHSKLHCMELTNFIIWTCIPISAPIAVSLLASIPIAFFICWIGNEEQEKILLQIKVHQLKKEKEALRKELEAKEEKKCSFNVDTCTEQQLLDRCKELNFSELNTWLAVEFFIKKTKHSIIADKLVVQEKTITTRKKRMRPKLNKK